MIEFLGDFGITQILAARPGVIERPLVTSHKALELINMLDDSGDYPNDWFNNLAEWREHFIEYLYSLPLGREFVDSINKHGIKVPGLIVMQPGRNRVIVNGHHRLA